MQLRPLEIPADETHFITPYERLIFNSVARARSYYEFTYSPLFYALSLEQCLENLGVSRMPLLDRNGQYDYPKQPPYGSHPKTYLKWGLEKSRKNHAVLEIGELYYLVHIDLKSTRSGRWHVDQLIVRDGRNSYYMPCEEVEYRNYSEKLLDVVKDTIVAIDQPNTNYHFVLKQFKDGISHILETMDAIATDCQKSDAVVMPSQRFPFTL